MSAMTSGVAGSTGTASPAIGASFIPSRPSLSPSSSPSWSFPLLRVKRKRDEPPLDSLILSGQADHPHQPKRSALEDLRHRLKRTTLQQLHQQDEGQTREGDGDKEKAVVVVRKVFKLVGTVQTPGETVDDALLTRIADLQSQRRASSRHPSLPPESSSLSAQADRHMERSRQRAATAREEKLRQARASAASASVSPSSRPPSYATLEPFTFLDVEVSRPSPLGFPPSTSASRPLAPPLPPLSVPLLRRKQARLQSELRSGQLEQERKDRIFSRAMAIVKAMPDKEMMAAYKGLLDDYHAMTEQADTTASTGRQTKSFVQQVEERGEAEAAALSLPRPQAGERIDVMAALGQRPQSMEGDAAGEGYVYDVYHVVEGGEDEERKAGEREEESEDANAGRVVIDSRVAGWFGLVLDEEQQLDSDEDSEDENRESAPGNDYGDEEEGEEDDAEEEGEEGERRVESLQPMTADDEDEEFHRLRLELKRSQNALIAQSDNEDGNEEEEESDDEDEYEAAHRWYRSEYDREI